MLLATPHATSGQKYLRSWFGQAASTPKGTEGKAAPWPSPGTEVPLGLQVCNSGSRGLCFAYRQHVLCRDALSLTW